MKTHPPSRRIRSRLAVLTLGVAVLATPVHAAEAPAEVKLPSRLAAEYRHTDRNADGRLSWAEFLAGAHAPTAFRQADGNCDGRLDPQEYGAARALERRKQLLGYLDDVWLTTRVKARLLLHDLPSGLDIQVSSNEGEVRLAGRVEDARQAAEAITVAKRVAGVEALRADLALAG